MELNTDNIKNENLLFSQFFLQYIVKVKTIKSEIYVENIWRFLGKQNLEWTAFHKKVISQNLVVTILCTALQFIIEFWSTF